MNYRVPELLGFLLSLTISFVLFHQQSRILIHSEESGYHSEIKEEKEEETLSVIAETDDDNSSQNSRVLPSPPPMQEATLKTNTYKVKFGDTLYGFFIQHIPNIAEVQRIIHLLKKHNLLKKFKAGTEFSITLEPQINEDQNLNILYFYSDKTKIIIERDTETNELILRKKTLPSLKKMFAGTIKQNLYFDAKKLGVPDLITNQFARLISHNVDFQRSIREGDTFEIFTEIYEDPETGKSFPGNLYYGSVKIKEGLKDLYRYKDESGGIHYYSGSAQGTTKKLLKTPVPGAPISSRFGLRKHPILGYSKMHQGIDFAAPRGTPVLAAGDGVVQKAFRFGSFGNYVLIKHTSKLKTAYAHLNRFAKNIRPGVKVKQGQVIAYVGNTGRSTGPHLHYEIHMNNKKVNPQKIKLPSTQKLSNEEVVRFKGQKQKIDAMMKAASISTTARE